MPPLPNLPHVHVVLPVNKQGTIHADTIKGTALADHMYGVAGNDHLYGYAGNDALYGGRGNDTVYGGAGNDIVGGAENNDKLYGEAGNDLLMPGSGTDFAYGGAGNDTYEITGVSNCTLSDSAGAHDIMKGAFSFTAFTDLAHFEALDLYNPSGHAGADGKIDTLAIVDNQTDHTVLRVLNYFGNSASTAEASHAGVGCIEQFQCIDGTHTFADIATLIDHPLG